MVHMKVHVSIRDRDHFVQQMNQIMSHLFMHPVLTIKNLAIGLYQASEGESKTYSALGVGCCAFSERCAPASSLGSGGVLLQVPGTAISHEEITDLASVA